MEIMIGQFQLMGMNENRLKRKKQKMILSNHVIKDIYKVGYVEQMKFDIPLWTEHFSFSFHLKKKNSVNLSRDIRLLIEGKATI